MTYATVSELEGILSTGKKFERILSPTENVYTIINDAAQRLGKGLLPLEEINTRLSAYVSAHPQKASSFRLKQYPRMFRGLVELVLPQQNVDAWADDTEAYAGRSARNLLSVLDVKASEASIKEVYDTFAEAMQYVSVLDFPLFEEFHYFIRLAQYEQLLK